MATVKEVLQLAIFNEIHVVAGEKGIERKVEHVTVMEVPDIKRWLRGNDFLITSLYSVRNDVSEQVKLIRDLSDICCCIAVKTGQYVQHISPELKAAADECQIPLLDIPFSFPYIDIIINVMNLIFEEGSSSTMIEKYIRDIVYDAYSDEILMVERGRLFGFAVDKNYYTAMNIYCQKSSPPDKNEMLSLKYMGKTLAQFVKSSSDICSCSVVVLEKGILLLLEGRDSQTLERFMPALEKETVKQLEGRPDKSFLKAGLGSVRKGMKGIRDSYSDAFQSLRIGKLLYTDQLFYRFSNLETFCVIERVLTKADRTLFTKILEKIKSRELMQTLIQYYECDSSAEQTAIMMFTHKNTIKYRLNRIQELTGLDLKKTDDNFKLYLAILTNKMCE